MSDLEKVARAMYADKQRREAAKADGGTIPWSGGPEYGAELLHLARAAVEALREPSEGMVEAGWAVAPMYDDPATSPGDYWAAMIDAILDPKSQALDNASTQAQPPEVAGQDPPGYGRPAKRPLQRIAPRHPFQASAEVGIVTS